MSPNSNRQMLIKGLGLLIGVVGLVLLIGGARLVTLGGSAYYALSGLGLLVSGVLLFRQQLAGIWTYLGVFVLTLFWGILEAGGDFWAWVPRFVSPFVLLLAVLAMLPMLDRARWSWGKYGVLATGLSVGFAALGIILYETPGGPERLTEDRPAVDASGGADWVSYGNSQAQRYSGLKQINRSNVAKLDRVWLSHTGDLPEDTENNSYGAETTPLKIGNRLYLCSATNQMIALNAATGEEVWRYDPNVDKNWIPYTAACRGVVHYESDLDAEAACHARVIEGTLDGRIIAVDAETGEPCTDFGENGEVDIKTGMGDIVPGMVSITSPPSVVSGVIVTNHQVLDGQKLEAPSGVIKGFDVMTGEWLWSWDMTRPDISVAPPEGDHFTRGTPNSWAVAAGDDELGLAYIPMGNSAVDYWSGSRTKPENAYATSLVALDVRTGRPAWHFQTVHKDVWDYDLGSQPSLFDFEGSEGVIPAILIPSKQGDLYILDRATGEPLVDFEERAVPQGGVEPGERSETQPFSRYHTLAKPPLEEKDMWGMTLIDQMFCRIQYRKAAYDGIYTPPTVDRRWIQYPGYNGGSDWGSVAIDPERRLIVANYNDMPNYNRLVPREEADRKGWAPREEARGGSMGHGAEGAGDPQAGAPYAIDVNAGWRMPVTGLLCKEPPYGGIRAIDLESGETVWDRPLGTARKNGPFGLPTGIPLTIGTPNNGGPLVTAGDLVFVAAATDDLIRAIDLRSGKTVWQDTLPAGGQATPITYQVGGRQYLVLMTGGHHFMETPVGDQIIAWALPEEVGN
ncbi:membrane-bound PQQ-dependent dehydrogenase, glucose/quinate/shikimate family [Hyphomonas sp.]|uniref:membrane-bound PQQ-dependent dehydrogenase, glucose/quinate/shikimate family n=1 Tax=Hyphomonas sp. TaxID=87 RepID=UPI0032D942D7